VTSCLYHVLLDHPFSAWGEMFLISLQCAIQCVLFWTLSGEVSIPSRIAGAAVVVGISRIILTRGLPSQYLYMLGVFPIFLSIWSRLPQIILNLRQKHTGQLALVTFALSGLGNLARVFTTLKQTPDDTISLISMIVSALLNFTLVLQIIMYWDATAKVLSAGTKNTSARAITRRGTPSRRKSD
jgi:mannose-P-dolichol utilization defect protein 1